MLGEWLANSGWTVVAMQDRDIKGKHPTFVEKADRVHSFQESRDILKPLSQRMVSAGVTKAI